MPPASTCIFCQIVAGKIPCHKLFENAAYLAFLDIQPITPGHALVIPKAHAPDLMHATPADRQGLLDVIVEIAPAILHATGATGFNVGFNTGPDAGQVIMHTHAHLIPRKAKDGLMSWGRNAKPGMDLDTLAKRIMENRERIFKE